MKHYLSILILSLLLLVACDPAAELGTPFHKGQEVVLTAAIGEQRPQMMPQKHPHPQRVSGKDSDTTIDLLWDEGDEIRVHVGEASSVFRLVAGAGTANASFIGTMPADGSSYTVSYPVNYSDALLQQQTYVPNGIAKGLMKMRTSSPGTIDDGFTLQAEHAVLGLQLTGNSEIGKLVLTKNGADGKAATPSYTLNCTSIVLTDVPTLFYIVLPTGTWEHGFTVTVYAADNTTIIDSLITTKPFTFESTNATMMAAKEVTVLPEYVDLGLSVKWATFNVGATSPEDYGDYFAWGETEPKEEYSWKKYKWSKGTENNITITKYNSTDSKHVLEPGDDAAHVHWGGKWRMPTIEEQTELREQCIWTWTSINGIWGHLVTGPNGKSIFLPAAGNITNTDLSYANVMGYQWSSSVKPGICAHRMHFSKNIIEDYDGGSRACGASIRPVYDDRPQSQTEHLTFTVNGVSFQMIRVEGGKFMMGAMEGDKQAHANEKPAHQVTLTYDYYIGQTEVTQALWQAVMGNNPSTMIGDNLPVNNVLWEDADAFTKRLSELTGCSFHLPTEAEWEFAARGGNKSQGYLYAGSNNIQEVAWYGSNSGNTTKPVGTKQPNELGIYDMSGNVIEWCSDWLGPYSAEPQVNPIGPATGAYHVYCGGCWYLPDNVCRCTHRRQTTAGYGEAAVGLRVALREKVEPVAVDMGLSVKWANFNIGAFHPTHCGNYFAWGETEPKEEYSWATYKWCEGTDKTMTKYCSDSNYGNNGFTDNKMELDLSDDAARTNWGGNWRMPTKAELDQLISECTWTESTQNGIKGYTVTSKHTGNSIFFPYSGYFNHDNSATIQGVGTIFYYWSSEGRSNRNAYDINNRARIVAVEQNTRRVGFPIRPVYDDTTEQ